MSGIVDALGLTLDPRDAQDVFDDAAQRWSELEPDAEFAEGIPEAHLMEAFAVAASTTIDRLNAVPETILDAIFTIYDAARDPGQPAGGVVTITLDGTRSGVIAAGTEMTANDLDLIVATDTAYTDASSVAVPVRTAEPGSAGNLLTVGTEVRLDDAVPYAAAAAVTTAFSGGADAETNAAYVARVGHVFGRMTAALVRPSDLTYFVLEDPRVAVATTIDLWDGADPETIGTDKGHGTVAAHGRAGTLDDAVLAELRTAIQAIVSADKIVHVMAAEIIEQPVSLAVHPNAGVASAQVIADVQAAITAWLAALPFGGVVRRNEIIALVGAVPSVDYVDAVTVPATDVTLDPYALARAGTITVTVI